MSTKINVSKLNELRIEVGRLLQRAYELGEPEKRSVHTVLTSAVLLIVFCGNAQGDNLCGILLVCYRKDKNADDIEVCRISKKDASDGPLPKRIDKYMAKVAAFLERRGLYQPRGVITDKTPNLFEDEKVKRMKV